MTDHLTKVAYQTVQNSKTYFSLAHKSISTQLLKTFAPPRESQTNPISPKLLMLIRERLDRLIETDWNDAERGIYPTDLLFDHPWEDFLRHYPLLCLDMPQVWMRSQQNKHQEFASDIDTTRYPAYYLQNFHHQTDGYLSENSANLYDLQVELLFNGSADAMRRRILAPLKRSLNTWPAIPQNQLRILDVACGTGRTLKFLRGMLPKAALFGIDLSPAYLRKANEILSQIPGELPQLSQANAEEIPYRDDYFHGVTSVFLFHELPAHARQTVINECFRVLKPGGSLTLCDSIQVSDSPELKEVMENFPQIFHEPYYRNYIQDDLVQRLETAGFTDIQTETHFMSKYWTACKPHLSE
ncbi:class I SAM-dependent methyltransferase [Oscillatoria acuminata]|uniref:Methylase involved in ubiquinone/menaquinone biosynthesis n=1 Tax=Oscillatoria acuminata PCC 6304 TaxID=56110 RepID=K9TFS9_9CYAN|nr:class I SAM-dependent methyltransferase [Oscillatoria acuminata]AFY81727.1 methylase involved in ubiquinone/menaquinone biosynthesis [Oscillatoria acuminata PCC 6304]